MMDLRVSVVLLLAVLTGGHSLKCYSCSPDPGKPCEAKEEECGKGFSKCASAKVESTGSTVLKACVPTCKVGTNEEGTITTHCCDTDLCNGADGVYKGSFLLLLSPLLFYFLFQ